MPQVLQRLNPFEPREVITEKVEVGSTIQDWFEQHGEFELPTVCRLNNEYLLRSDWPLTELKKSDFVEFRSMPAGIDPITLAITAAVAATASFAVAALLPKPDTDTSGYDQSPTYNLEAQSNRARLYQPIPDHYGRVQFYPDLAAQPYREFGNDNEEILYQLFLVGHGEYEYEDLKVEDTPVSNFEEISSQIIEPGQAVTLFPDNVETSVEVGNINLEDTSYKGGFVANQANTTADALAFDFVCPRGVYRSKKSGSFRQWTNLQVQMECREIDALGDPVGAGTWTVLGTETITAVNRDVQRRTFRYPVTAGRYEARVRRVNAPNGDTLVQDDCSWAGLKAYITGDQNYGDVSLIAVRANATNDLSSKSQFRFNIIATRKLPTFDGSTWGPAVATRDLAPAIRHVLLAGHGGGKSESEIDLDRLEELDAIWKAAGIEFSYRFDRLGNLWKNLSVMLRAGRGAPNLEGSLVSFSRHQAQVLPTAMFNAENMLPGSFSIDDTFPDEETEDHIIVEYFDENTWRREEVVCVLPGSTQLRPKRLQLHGITNRQQAFAEGMYEAAKLKHMTTAVKFTTELEGMIPQFMDLISIGHDLPGWGQSGHLQNVVGTTYTLSQNADFSEGGNHYISFRKPNGSLAGPFLATAGAEPDQVVVLDPIGFAPVFDEARMPTMFQFGPSTEFDAQAVVVDVTPSGNDRVTITALLEVDEVHDDYGAAPVLNYDHALEADPVAPVVSGVSVVASEVDPDTAIVTWNQAAGAESYVLQKSTDGGSTWLYAGESFGTRHPIVLESGEFLIRVAAKGAIRGPYDQVTVQLTAKPKTDFTADIFYQEAAPSGGNLDIGDIWIKVLDSTGQAVEGSQYLESDPASWANAAVPEYEWVLNDTNHTMIVALVNAHNANYEALKAQNDAGQAIIAAAGAQALAAGKITAYFQNDPPNLNLVEGDLWVDGDANNALYRYDSSITTWILIQDSQSALTAALLAQATADGKIRTFSSLTPPTAEGVGDFWVDESDLNHLYRWDGSVWVSTQDGRIAQAAADAAQALSDATAAVAAAAGAQATADGKVNTFWQNDPPPAASDGDLWFDKDDKNKTYRWDDVTDSWDLTQDQDIAQAILDAAGAQATADGKVALYYLPSNTPPGSAAVGDLWSQVDTGVTLRWSGSNWGQTVATIGAPPGTTVNNVPVDFITNPPENHVPDPTFQHESTYWAYDRGTFRFGRGQLIPQYLKVHPDGASQGQTQGAVFVRSDYWVELDSDTNDFVLTFRLLLQQYSSGFFQPQVRWYAADKTTLITTEILDTIDEDVGNEVKTYSTAAAKPGAKWAQIWFQFSALNLAADPAAAIRLTDVGFFYTGITDLPGVRPSGGTANVPIIKSGIPDDVNDGKDGDEYTDPDTGLSYKKQGGSWIQTSSNGAPDGTPIGDQNIDTVLDFGANVTSDYVIDPYFRKSGISNDPERYWR